MVDDSLAKVKYHPSYAPAFLDYWFEKNEPQWMQAFNDCNQVESAMIQWLLEHDKVTYDECNRTAIQVVAYQTAPPSIRTPSAIIPSERELVQDMSPNTEPRKAPPKGGKYQSKGPSYPPLAKLAVVQAEEGGEWIATAEANGVPIEGKGKSDKQALYFLFQEAKKHGRFQYPK